MANSTENTTTLNEINFREPYFFMGLLGVQRLTNFH